MMRRLWTTALLLALLLLGARWVWGDPEKRCLEAGWKRLEVTVAGKLRQVLWKGPEGSWKGTILALHGGGGSYCNFGAGPALSQPMIEFSQLANARGYAVVCPDSGQNLVPGYGKRWDCMAEPQRENVDVLFLAQVLDRVIPSVRPPGSGRGVCLTGISNGGFMTVLLASKFPSKITAFAPVSCGDPYGTWIDLITHSGLRRPLAPGIFRDRGTHKNISETGAARGPEDRGEVRWPVYDATLLPPFKQFHACGDGVVDLSCMQKVGSQLRAHGFRDAGAYLMPDADSKRGLLEHFWMREYNRPMLDFFDSALQPGQAKLVLL